jgi:hypothetical protein
VECSPCTTSFGLVSIPVRIHTATGAQAVHFNQLHAKCGGRLKQKQHCALDAERFATLDLVELVPESTVDSVYIERSQYLGQDRGGDNAFTLLVKATRRAERMVDPFEALEQSLSACAAAVTQRDQGGAAGAPGAGAARKLKGAHKAADRPARRKRKLG